MGEEAYVQQWRLEADVMSYLLISQSILSVLWSEQSTAVFLNLLSADPSIFIQNIVTTWQKPKPRSPPLWPSAFWSPLLNGSRSKFFFTHKKGVRGDRNRISWCPTATSDTISIVNNLTTFKHIYWTSNKHIANNCTFLDRIWYCSRDLCHRPCITSVQVPLSTIQN